MFLVDAMSYAVELLKEKVLFNASNEFLKAIPLSAILFIRSMVRLSIFPNFRTTGDSDLCLAYLVLVLSMLRLRLFLVNFATSKFDSSKLGCVLKK